MTCRDKTNDQRDPDGKALGEAEAGHGEAPSSGEHARQAAPGTQTIRARVLIAEDNIINQEVAVGALERLGCKVDLAATGKDAVEMVSRFSYDLIFMDCVMPEMDGFEATRRIRSLEGGGRHIPIIALTARAMSGNCEQCLAAGMDDYLSKPVRLKDFDTMVDRWSPAAKTSPEMSEGKKDRVDSEASEHSAEDELLSPPLDPAVVGELRQLGNEDEAFLDGLFESFIEQAGRTIELLRQAARGKDARAIAKVAGSLKESSMSVGATRLADVCQDMETLGGSGTLAEAGTLMGQVEHEFGRVKHALTT